MYERFQKKKPGDTLSARECNKWNEQCELIANSVPGSGITQAHGKTVLSSSVAPPFIQHVVRIVSMVADASDQWWSGLYKGQYCVWSEANQVWDNVSEQTYTVDARRVQLKFLVGDYVVCYWDSNRASLIPIYKWDASALGDSNGTSVAIPSTGKGGSDIRFALEYSPTGSVWSVVNNRVCQVNGNVLNPADEEPTTTAASSGTSHASGSMFYTFSVNGHVYVRVRAETDLTTIAGESVTVSGVCCLKLNAKAKEGIAFTAGAAMSYTAVVMPGWAPQAKVQNQLPAHKFPTYEVASGNAVKISTPLTIPQGATEIPANETWTIEAEVAAVFEVDFASSSSSPSSVSSLSTSSLGSSESSISTSSSCLASSSSSISTSSSSFSSSSSVSTLSTSSSSSSVIKDCINCNAGTTPSRMYVVIEGVEKGTCPVGECEKFNGAFFLEQDEFNPCLYQISVGNSCGGYPGYINVTLGGTYLIVRAGFGSGYITWRSAVPTWPTNCSAINQSVPFISTDGSCAVPGSNACQVNSA